MRIGVPREIVPGETRVALTPSAISMLLKDGHDIVIETQSGNGAQIDDKEFEQAGARITSTAQQVYEQSDVIFKVQPPSPHRAAGRHEAELIREGSILLGMLAPLAHSEVTDILARRHVTSYALDLVPRTSRAQSMDALTSMATIAGYKAVIVAANRLDKMFPLLMTAAGTIAPAAVLVLGAGVAGLQAIATAKRLGAKVEAFDPRPAVHEQIRSLGATCIEMEHMEETGQIELSSGYAREQSETFLDRERAAILERLPSTHVVICTAQVFGKPAPLLITEEMVERMRPGSVIVDLAADQGGNCALTQPERDVCHHGVDIVSAGNLPASVPYDASLLYSHTIVNLFRYLYPHEGTPPDEHDDIVSATCLTRNGAIVQPELQEMMNRGASK